MAIRRQSGRLTLAVSFAALVAVALGGLGYAALAPFLEHDLSISPENLSHLTTALYGAAVVGAAGSGWVNGRVGAWRLLAGALLLVAVADVLAAVAPSSAWLTAVLVIGGLGWGAATPLTNTLVFDRAPAGRQGLALSAKQTGIPAGSLLVGLLPVLALIVGWRATELIVAMVIVAIAALAFHYFRHDDVRPRRSVTTSSHVPLVALCGFLFGGMQLSFVTYLVTYLVRREGVSIVVAGLLFSLAQAMGFAGRFFWGVLSDHLPRRESALVFLSMGSIGTTLSLALIPHFGIPVAVLLVILFGFVNLGWNGVYMVVVTTRAGGGFGAGASVGVIYLGSATIPLVFGWLLTQSGGYQAGWWFLAALAVLSLGLTVATARRGDRHARPSSITSDDVHQVSLMEGQQ